MDLIRRLETYPQRNAGMFGRAKDPTLRSGYGMAPPRGTGYSKAT